MLFFLIINLIKVLVIIIPLLLSVAYYTHIERKILGAVQRRRGPNVVGAYGLLQPLSDGLKLFLKEIIIPSNANSFIFTMAPALIFSLSLMGWAVIPFDKYAIFAETDIGLLYILAASSLGVYGIIMSGWSSNSKYAFLGALRSTAQMVSYEIPIGFTFVIIGACCGSFNLQTIIECQTLVWFVIPLFPLFLLFFIAGLAETNRHPFDLPEAEAELVSGYNVEYSGMSFALFSLAEYSNMLMMGALASILFLGGWHAPLSILSIIPGGAWFAFKIVFFVILYVLARGALPRFRYDQLMLLGWEKFIPITLAMLIFVLNTLFSFNLI